MFANYGKSLIKSSFTFLSKNAIELDIPKRLSLQKQCLAVENTRAINKLDLKLNNKLPNISVDPQTYEVFSNGELLTCEPLDEVPMSQRYFLLNSFLVEFISLDPAFAKSSCSLFSHERTLDQLGNC